MVTVRREWFGGCFLVTWCPEESRRETHFSSTPGCASLTLCWNAAMASAGTSYESCGAGAMMVWVLADAAAVDWSSEPSLCGLGGKAGVSIEWIDRFDSCMDNFGRNRCVGVSGRKKTDRACCEKFRWNYFGNRTFQPPRAERGTCPGPPSFGFMKSDSGGAHQPPPRSVGRTSRWGSLDRDWAARLAWAVRWRGVQQSYPLCRLRR